MNFRHIVRRVMEFALGCNPEGGAESAVVGRMKQIQEPDSPVLMLRE